MRSATLTMLLVVIASAELQAGTITSFNDRATFNSAVGGPLNVEDFTSDDHFPITTGILNSATNLPSIGIVPGLIQPGVTYSTPIGTGNFFNIDGGGGYVGGFLDGFSPSDRDLTITFDSPQLAFGFDTGGLGASSFDVTIQFTSGPDQVFNNIYPSSLQFFGFRSNLNDIKSVIVSNNNSSFGFDLDNFTFNAQATAVEAPEPASLALWSLLSMAGLAVWRRRGTSLER